MGNTGETSGLEKGHEGEDNAHNLRLQRLVSLGELSAQIAHEINGCLAAMRLHLAAAGGSDAHGPSTQGGRSSSSLRASLASATECADRITGLVDEIRRFGRPDAARAEPVSLDDVARAALRLMGPSIARITRVEARTEPTMPVLGHRDRLVQVVLNLLRNAIDALEACGRPYDARHVVVSTRSDDHHAVVCVQDDGPGIPAELRARVFEPYFTTKGPDHGTGLGLSISHAIVIAHGGELRLDDAPGGGTRAEVRLPLARRS